MRVLEVNHLIVRYGEAEALRGISLSVQKGHTVSLIGSNGAGKSTRVQALMGMHTADEGTILFKGQDITSVSARERPRFGIGLVPEGRRLFTSMTVQDNLLLGLHHPAARSRSDGNLNFIYDLFPVLGKRRKQVAGTMSGGEQQMVADRKSTRLNSSHVSISYAVFCLKKKRPKSMN